MKNPWTTLSTKTVYSNPWIDVEHHEVITPGGSKSIYGKVHYNNIAVGIIPLDEDNNTWIVGQHRYPNDIYSWEIPEGGSPIGTSRLQSAKRELKEETGIIAQDWQEILKLHTSNSVCDEEAYIYIARDLTFGESEPEDTEELVIKKLPFEELYQMTLRGEITDAMSVAGILRAWQWMFK